ncbi:MAG: Ig-like domain-containing protein [Clostridia bacterium]|nr:Ig-like domain-containing protein [Clostridia bacterium]
MKQRKTRLILACLGAFLLLCGMSAVPRCIPAEIEYNLLNPVPAAVAVADGFTGIETLTEEQYEYAQGVVTLKDTALQVLGEGEHTLTFLFGAETETVTVRIISLMPTLAAMPQAPVFDLYQPEDVFITLAMEHCVLTDVPQVQGYTYENGVLVLPAEALSDLPVGQHILTLVCGQVSFDLELTVKDTTPLGLEVNGTDIAQGSGEGWQYAEGCLQLESGAFTLSGSAAGVGILAADGAEVTLNGVQINGTVTGLGSLMIACEGENKIDGALKAPILTVSGGSLSVLSVEADDLLLDKTVVHADGTIKAQQTAQAVSAVLLAEEAPAFGSDTAVFLRQSADFYLLRSNAKLAASLTVPGEKLVLAVPYRVSLRTETGNTLTVAGTVLRAGTVSGVTGNVERATLVSRVRLNKSSAVISINKGEALGKQLLLTATINAGADIRKLTWESSNEAVATVDQNGMVTSVGTGRAYIYARATDGTRRYARCRVTVQKTPVSRISMDASQYLYLELGDTFGKTAIIPIN